MSAKQIKHQMNDPYKLLGVTKTASEDQIKAAYRNLAKKLHPDVSRAKNATAKFQEINEAYALLTDPVKRDRYDKTGSPNPAIIASKNGTYQLDALVVAGEVADIYRSESKVLKICRDHRNNDILENEAKVLKEIYPPDQKEEKKYRYLPKLLDSFKVNSGVVRQVNVFPHLANFYTLEQVRTAYPNGVQIEHAVWMTNRILEGLDFIHTKGYVHGAITPQHIMVHSTDAKVDPWNHGAKIVGFGAATKIGEHIKIMSPTWAGIYPNEVKNKGKAKPDTDIYMAIKLLVYLMGGDPNNDRFALNAPKYLQNFTNGCLYSARHLRPQSAWDLRGELEVLMRKYYGPKKYVHFGMPKVN